MSNRRRGREISGVLLLDKPIGLTSNQALTTVKIIFGAKKAGHTGSLDPLACGMLPICFGDATKFSQFLLEADKQYLVEAKLGIRTKTGDEEGEVIATRKVAVDEEQIEAVLTNFRGKIEQVPSMYSALKFQGKPLYSYARQGIEIERQSRPVMIKELKLLEFNDDILKIRVACSKGTYIRTLVDDIGEQLGCGAHVALLRRTYVEPYQDTIMISLDNIKREREDRNILDEMLLPIDSALSAWPQVVLTESITYHLKQGQPVLVPRAPTSGWVRLYDNDEFLGVGEILDDGRVAPRRLITTKTAKF
ncbi:MAG: tRNA pseudouridine(55) synthase TruB [Gammaproteobacteria bacterium]|nr:tRNA pseudouridine(55) synthase TruB [Gammaproteobacteria bacterium]